jgi:hypothetical protein
MSCFPNVASSVFGLSLSVFILCPVFLMLPVVSPDCPCLSSSCFLFSQTRTIRRHYWQHWENKIQDEDRQGQSEDTTDNIGKTRHRMKTGLSLSVFILCLAFSMLSVVSLDCPCLSSSCFLFSTGNIGKTRNMMKTNKANPETQLATLGKQDTGWRQTRTIRNCSCLSSSYVLFSQCCQ